VKLKLPDFVTVLLVLAAAWLAFGGELPNWVSPSGKPTAATYVHVVKTPIPDAVSSGLSKLNEQGIVATHYAKGTTDGPGDVPDQYKVAVAASNELPFLVTQAGDKVLRVVNDPRTEEAVLEAAQ